MEIFKIGIEAIPSRVTGGADLLRIRPPDPEVAVLSFEAWEFAWLPRLPMIIWVVKFSKGCVQN